MRRVFMAVSLVTAGLVGGGYLVGQLHGVTPALAATKHAKVKVKATTTKTAKVKANQTSNTGTAHADGKVVSVVGNTITVAPDADPAGSTEYTKVTTILLTGTTTYKGGATAASIVKDAYIVADGSVSSDGLTLTATSVGIGGKGGGHGGGHGGGGPHADGTVLTVVGNTVTIQSDTDPAGSTEYSKVTTILLTGTTTYEGNTTQASIVQGANIEAEGTLNGDGTILTATQVDVRGNHP